MSTGAGRAFACRNGVWTLCKQHRRPRQWQIVFAMRFFTIQMQQSIIVKQYGR